MGVSQDFLLQGTKHSNHVFVQKTDTEKIKMATKNTNF